MHAFHAHPIAAADAAAATMHGFMTANRLPKQTQCMRVLAMLLLELCVC
jgi:hypothetical protein